VDDRNLEGTSVIVSEDLRMGCSGNTVLPSLQLLHIIDQRCIIALREFAEEQPKQPQVQWSQSFVLVPWDSFVVEGSSILKGLAIDFALLCFPVHLADVIS